MYVDICRCECMCIQTKIKQPQNNITFFIIGGYLSQSPVTLKNHSVISNINDMGLIRYIVIYCV